MALLTTTIGAYPKPDYVPAISGGQSRGLTRAEPTKAYDVFLSASPADAEERFTRATREAVRDQVGAGIDVPTDGEIRREHYVFYHCRHLRGIDFGRLVRKSMRNDSWQAEVPTVCGPISAGPPFLPDDWRCARAASDRPIKITVPGPMTITDTTADAHYGDERALGAALADALNVEIRALADAGCAWIQVDEPVMARYPDKAVDFGIDNLSRCFHGVPEAVTRCVHVCCGYPAVLDEEDYPKADREAYFAIADGLEAALVDVISIEDAHRHNDFGLLERFATSRVALGVIGIARTRIEPVDEIVARLEEALEHIDRNRLIAAPDCGLIMLDRATARAKLANLVLAARAL
ncbi:MAG: 5-methyltetrahydropteroyltriglutamate--homocysteine methyltransferase [Proteobacteria bacterium]|nr:5-methyltetrahydropteroyltriglutamate--homocysteine methyltransferase [Pseudomonadota bacterium]